MRKVLIALALILGLCYSVDAKKKDDNWRHNIQIEGVSKDMTNSVVKISIIDKKKDKITDDLLGRGAVYAIIFKGYKTVSSSNTGYADSTQPPLVEGLGVEQQYADFFNPFFENGDYSKYVQVINDSRRVAKVGKEYKVSAKVSVNVRQLRRDLEQIGVVKGLNSGW